MHLRISQWAGTMAISVLVLSSMNRSNAQSEITIWPSFAPGERSKEIGTLMPGKAGEAKPIDRVSNVRLPTMDYYPAKVNSSNTVVLILPGGGFSYVVPNLEGSEAAQWLNQIGIDAYVLRYRTKESAEKDEPLWKRPLQDCQRAMRWIRHRDASDTNDSATKRRVGILGFSAGGQVASIAHALADEAVYPAVDTIDDSSCKPDFSLLIYPWQILNAKTNELVEPIRITETASPAFIVHTSDDASTSVGAAKLYIAFKQKNVSAELHVFQNGGHGYGVRERPNSVISTWPDRATEWLRIQGLLKQTVP